MYFLFVRGLSNAYVCRMTLKTRTAGFPSNCQCLALPNVFHCLGVPGLRTVSAILMCTFRVGRVCFLLKKLIAGNFPHSSSSVLSPNIFQDLLFSGNSFDWKNYRPVFRAVQSGADNIKRKNSYAFSELVDD